MSHKKQSQFFEMPRVLILEPSGNLWGSERVLLDFLNSVTRATWEIGVCCPPNTQIINSLESLSVKIFPTFITNLHLKTLLHRLLATSRLLKTALTFKPELIYVNQSGPIYIALLVSRLLHLPVITHVRLTEDVQHVLRLNADVDVLPKIICISNYIKELFQAGEVAAPGQVAMLYDPYTPQCDWNLISPTVRAEPVPTVCCAGRLAYTKGQDILLRAIAELKREGIEVEGRFLGEAGPSDSFGIMLRKLSCDLGINDNVQWQGFSDNVLSSLATAVASVCPSRKEPLGRVVFESWDAGTIPVAWIGSGGCAEIIRDSGGGFLYECQEGGSLASTLKKVLSLTFEERATIVNRGRRWLEEHCDPFIYAENMMSLWEESLRKI